MDNHLRRPFDAPSTIDIIKKINNVSIKAMDEFNAFLRKNRNKEEFLLKIKRGERIFYLSVEKDGE